MQARFKLILQICPLIILLFVADASAQSVNAPQIKDEDSLVSALLAAKPNRRLALLEDHRRLAKVLLWQKLVDRASKAYYEDGLNKVLNIYEVIVIVAQQLDDKKLIATSYFDIGRIHSELGNIAAAIESYQRSEDTFTQAGLQQESIDPLTDLGALYLYASNYQKAKECSEKLIRVVNTITKEALAKGASKEQYGTAAALAILGNISKVEGKYDQSITYFDQSLKLFEKLKGGNLRYATDMAEALADVGSVHRTIGNHVDALSYFNRALEVANKLPYKSRVADVLLRMGLLYLEQRDYIKATDLFNRSLQVYLPNEAQNRSAVALLYLNLGVIHLRQGSNRKALNNFKLSLENAEKQGSNKDVVIAAQEGIGSVHKEEGNYVAALEWLDKGWSLAKETNNRIRMAEIL